MTINEAHRDRFTPNGLMDFAPSITNRISALIDDALVTHTRAEYERTRGSGQGEVAKNRIGAGYIGVECGRDLAYRYHKHPKEAREKEYVAPGELQRHAEAGHWTEEKSAEWFRMAGFDVRTHKAEVDHDGKHKQFGFKAAGNEELQQ